MATIEVRVDYRGEPRDAREVRLQFPLTRTDFLQVTVNSDEIDVVAVEKEGIEVGLLLERPLSPQAAFMVEVIYEGEPPGEPEVTFNSQLVLLGGGRAREPAEQVEAFRSAVRAASRSRIQALVEARKAEITALKGQDQDGSLGKALDFFLDYDLQTNRVLLRDRGGFEDRIELLRRNAEWLISRLKARFEGCRELPAVPTSDVLQISSLQLCIFKKHFPKIDAATGKIDALHIDVAGLDAAFIRFASGQLVSDHPTGWNGRPDSAWFFLFAEFALAAVEVCSEHDKAIWSSLLPTLIDTQPVFATIFKPRCATDARRPIDTNRLIFGSYKQYTPHNDRRGEAINDLRRRRETGRPTTYEQAHAHNARSAFPAGFSGIEDPCKFPLLNPLTSQGILGMNKLHTLLASLHAGPGKYLHRDHVFVAANGHTLKVLTEGNPDEAEMLRTAWDLGDHMPLGSFVVALDCEVKDWDQTPAEGVTISFDEQGNHVTTFSFSNGTPAETYSSKDGYRTFVVVLKDG